MRVFLVDPGQQVPFYCRGLARALAAAGDGVALVTAPLPHYDPGPAPPGVEVIHAFGRWLPAAGRPAAGAARPAARRAAVRRVLRAAGYPGELAALVRLAVARRPAVVHWQWSLIPLLDGLAIRRLRRAGITAVLTAYNVLPHERRPWQATQWRRLYRAVDGVIVHSHATRERLLALTGLAVEAVDVIPMAGDGPPTPVDRAAARASLGLPPDGPVALFLGHVRPYKGVPDLVAAWPRVAAALPAATLVVAGPIGDGGAAAAAVAAVATAARVEFRPGFVPTASVPAYLAAADVVVLPYRDTDDSAVLATALAHGRPVVATAVGGLPEALAGGGGVVVERGDAGALAGALVSVLGDGGRRAALAQAARAAAAAWTWRDAAARTREVYARRAAGGGR